MNLAADMQAVYQDMKFRSEIGGANGSIGVGLMSEIERTHKQLHMLQEALYGLRERLDPVCAPEGPQAAPGIRGESIPAQEPSMAVGQMRQFQNQIMTMEALVNELNRRLMI